MIELKNIGIYKTYKKQLYIFIFYGNYAVFQNEILHASSLQEKWIMISYALVDRMWITVEESGNAESSRSLDLEGKYYLPFVGSQ